MIVDSSAAVAIMLREPGCERLLELVSGAAVAGMGAPTAVEAGIVLSARIGPQGRTLLARFLQEGGIQVVPFGDGHWPVALDAYLRFGPSRHPAGLNFGDCLTYATARLSGLPLLCVGDDFARTDLTLVRPQL